MDPLLRMAGRVERFLGRVAVLCVLALLASQALLAGGLAPWLLRADDPLEGAPRAIPAWGRSAGGALTLAAEGCDGRAYVLVNGRRAASFDRPAVTVAVSRGDVIAVDAIACRRPGRFRVVAAGPGLPELPVGQEWTARGRVIVLGTVEWGR